MPCFDITSRAYLLALSIFYSFSLGIFMKKVPAHSCSNKIFCQSNSINKKHLKLKYFHEAKLRSYWILLKTCSNRCYIVILPPCQFFPWVKNRHEPIFPSGKFWIIAILTPRKFGNTYTYSHFPPVPIIPP